MSSEAITREELKQEVAQGMEQVKEFIKTTNEKAQDKFNDLIPKEEIEEATKNFNKLSDKMKKLQEQNDTIDEQLQKFMKDGTTTTPKRSTFAAEMEKAIESSYKDQQLSRVWKKNKGFSVELEGITGKAVGTMTTGASLTGEVIPVDYVPSIVEIDRVQTHIRRFFRQATTSSNTIRFNKEVVGEGGVDFQTEGSAKSKMDRDFAAVDNPVETLAGVVDISMQLLDDMPILNSFLPNMLRSEIDEKEDNTFLYGTGVAPVLGGLSLAANHTDFTRTSQVTTAQIMDLLMQAITRLKLNNQNPNGILLNPADWLELFQLKDTTNNYIRGLSFDQTTSTLFLLGVPVYEHNAVTAGDYFVADWTRNAMIFDRMGVTIDFSTENNDNFEKNIVSVRAEERLAFVVMKQLSTIYGDISTDIAAIQA